MSKANVMRFVEDVRNDPRLQNELINKLGISAIVGVANNHGYSITEQDVRDYAEGQHLAEKELEAVAGGGGFTAYLQTTDLLVKELPPPPPPTLIQNLIIIL